MILRTLVVFVTALCFLLFLGSHALLRQENTGFKNGNGPSAKVRMLACALFVSLAPFPL